MFPIVLAKSCDTANLLRILKRRDAHGLLLWPHFLVLAVVLSLTPPTSCCAMSPTSPPGAPVPPHSTTATDCAGAGALVSRLGAPAQPRSLFGIIPRSHGHASRCIKLITRTPAAAYLCSPPRRYHHRQQQHNSHHTNHAPAGLSHHSPPCQ